MILFPAIDLKDGACVRLKLGDMNEATVFNTDPAAQAKRFEEQGFEYLHVVDLNGAFAGKAVNGAAVEAILGAVTMPVQLGGGIRDLAGVEAWLAKGIRRVILGTIAVRDPDLVREACRAFPGRIAVGIDARAGRVAVEGWAETSELTIELGAPLRGRRRRRDHLHRYRPRRRAAGLNIPSTLALARAVETPVIASGGLASLADIRRLLEPDCRILEGAISGRALYDGRLDPAEALKPDPRCAEARQLMLKTRVIPVPRRQGRPCRQGRAVHRPRRCRRSGRGRQGL